MSKDKSDRIFKALADPTRRKILDFIKDSPKTTGEICNFLKKKDRCTVMLHLRVLETADLVIPKKEGRFRWNYINVVPIQKIYNRWIKDFATGASDLLSTISEDLG